jgi:hypothetical protein
MKTSTMTLIAIFAAFLMLAGTQGCYTQLGSTRDEEAYDNGGYDSEAVAQDDSSVDENAGQADENTQGYGENWDSQARFGFDYYYPYTYWPSVTFSMAYADPWFSWYNYDPWYSSFYSPWYYQRPWSPYSSYYGYGYGYGYYDPYYYYPGYYYQNVAPVPRTNREFGSSRGPGNTRGVNASEGMRGGGINDPQNMLLPTGSGRVVTGGTSGGKTGTAAPSQPARTSGASRTGVTRRAPRTSSSRDNSRIYRDRSSVSGSGGGGSSPSPSVQPPRSGSSGASSRGGTGRTQGSSTSTRSSGSSGRSASPQPSAAPRSSPPPPSSSGTSRGGGSRNPKP